MSKIEIVRKAMMEAMKAKDAPRKEACSLLLSALKAAAIDKRADLTEEEENAVILREIKQTKETMESAPAGREDIVQVCQARLAVLADFAPKSMSEEEIRAAIESVVASLGLETPTIKNKGLIMKNLMPLLKGKADSGLVNQLVSEVLGQ